VFRAMDDIRIINNVKLPELLTLPNDLGFTIYPPCITVTASPPVIGSGMSVFLDIATTVEPSGRYTTATYQKSAKLPVPIVSLFQAASNRHWINSHKSVIGKIDSIILHCNTTQQIYIECRQVLKLFVHHGFNASLTRSIINQRLSNRELYPYLHPAFHLPSI